MSQLTVHLSLSSSFSMAIQSIAVVLLLLFSHSALFFDLSFQFVILHLLVSVCTHFHNLFFRSPLRIIVQYWIYFLSLSILLTWLIPFNRLILTNESISKSPTSCINSLLYRFLQFSFTLTPHLSSTCFEI